MRLRVLMMDAYLSLLCYAPLLLVYTNSALQYQRSELTRKCTEPLMQTIFKSLLSTALVRTLLHCADTGIMYVLQTVADDVQVV
jgi:hypothetical protein